MTHEQTLNISQYTCQNTPQLVEFQMVTYNTFNTNYKCLQTVHMHAQSMVIYHIHNQFKYGWEITGIGQVICVQSGPFASSQSRTKWSISQPILKPVLIW
ncbi:hypothetical protein QVD99_003340 [Batrachochytrium dendrobatidis]|nr:hypothetical protein QVD99_003340 [Batrachochytrium dendrobatidis]